MRRGDAAPWAWAVWVSVVAAAFAFGVWRVWTVHHSSHAQLDAVEPRFARLIGLGDERARLQDALAQVGQLLERHVYPSSRDVSQAGNDAQQRAREIFAKAGLEVISSQLLTARTADQYERIPITLRLEGDMPALHAALAMLPTLSPTLFVQGMTINSVAANQPERALRVVAQLELFVLLARS